jgi:hypothetical protein
MDTQIDGWMDGCVIGWGKQTMAGGLEWFDSTTTAAMGTKVPFIAPFAVPSEARRLSLRLF